jgi:hypothetical protein
MAASLGEGAHHVGATLHHSVQPLQGFVNQILRASARESVTREMIYTPRHRRWESDAD